MKTEPMGFCGSATMSNQVADVFLDAVRRSTRYTSPYRHWLLQEAFPETLARNLASLPFPAPEAMTHDGRRESNNAKRVYFTREIQDRYPICRTVADTFNDPPLRDVLAQETGAALNDAILRIEYCQDTGDFWLEPHTDISVKKFTMLIYLSDDPRLANCGTDVYDSTPQHRLVHTAPYMFNGGLIFVPASDTWHGFQRRMIHGIRKSLIINYVSPEWRDKWELSYPLSASLHS
jgi:hypothetical protein